MEPMATGTHAELDAVRLRRVELRETIASVEHALAGAARGREVVWGEAVHAALETLDGDFVAHIEVTEGVDGLHRAIGMADPRLSHAVDRLTHDHAVIAAEIRALIAASEAPVTARDVNGLRERGTALITRLIKHRQRGADLIYEAFATDIGGAD